MLIPGLINSKCSAKWNGKAGDWRLQAGWRMKTELKTEDGRRKTEGWGRLVVNLNSVMIYEWDKKSRWQNFCRLRIIFSPDWWGGWRRIEWGAGVSSVEGGAAINYSWRCKMMPRGVAAPSQMLNGLIRSGKIKSNCHQAEPVANVVPCGACIAQQISISRC